MNNQLIKATFKLLYVQFLLCFFSGFLFIYLNIAAVFVHNALAWFESSCTGYPIQQYVLEEFAEECVVYIFLFASPSADILIFFYHATTTRITSVFCFFSRFSTILWTAIVLAVIFPSITPFSHLIVRSVECKISWMYCCLLLNCCWLLHRDAHHNEVSIVFGHPDNGKIIGKVQRDWFLYQT